MQGRYGDPFVPHGVKVRARAGILLGALGSLAIRRFLSPLLAGVRSTDPLSYGLVAAGLLLISLLAAHRPARQAARTDPAGILRSE